MYLERLDLGLNPLGVAQQQVALLPRLGVTKRAVGLVGAHVLDPDAHRPQAGQRLQGVDVLGADRRWPLLGSRAIGPISPTSS